MTEIFVSKKWANQQRIFAYDLYFKSKTLQSLKASGINFLFSIPYLIIERGPKIDCQLRFLTAVVLLCFSLWLAVKSHRAPIFQPVIASQNVPRLPLSQSLSSAWLHALYSKIWLFYCFAFCWRTSIWMLLCKCC